ncbi:MAG TPA: DinB family protein [Gemmatimonadales bacterium]|nr:DinB family protein [Gemmatimonadales bacterium]
MKRGDPRIRLLLAVLDGAFTAKGWQGATLSGSLRGLTIPQALWRPGPGRHNVWELVLHTAYWKHVVRQRVEGGRQGPFPRSPRNYPDPPRRPDAAAWRADIALLKRQHLALTRIVAALPPSRLAARVGRSRWSVAEQVFGIAAHDLYHTGQIQLLKALQRGR